MVTMDAIDLSLISKIQNKLRASGSEPNKQSPSGGVVNFSITKGNPVESIGVRRLETGALTAPFMRTNKIAEPSLGRVYPAPSTVRGNNERITWVGIVSVQGPSAKTKIIGPCIEP